jgi:hypothetical protein
MKTYIIQLELDDSVISIIDKLSWAKVQRVLLVCPPSEVFDLRKVDLLRLKRSAYQLGLTIGMVSKIREVRRIAADQEIPVFKSIKDAQRHQWIINAKDRKTFQWKPLGEIRLKGLDARPKEADWKNRFSVRLFFFSLGVLAVLIIAIMFVPSANIHLNLQDKNQTIILNVNARKQFNTVNLMGIIPSYTISVDVEGDKLVQITNKTSIPEKYATGSVLFTNLTDQRITIPSGTIVSRLEDTEVRFETIQIGEVSPGYGETVRVSIRALFQGENGNLDAKLINYLMGDLGANLTVLNPEPTRGGSNRYVRTATEKDRNQLGDELEADLSIQAIEKAKSLLSYGDIVFPGSIKLTKNIEEVYIPAAGQVGDQLSLHLVLSYTIQYAKYSDFLLLAAPILKAKIPIGYVQKDGLIEVETIDQPETISAENTKFNIRISQKIQKGINQIALTRLVQGVSVNNAYVRLEEIFGGEANPLIEIQPAWWPQLPLVPLRISISD